MDIKMKIILLILIAFQACAEDYSRLQAYKEASRRSSISLPSSALEKSNKMVVKFKDINQFDFLSFEEEYKLELLHCIAYGICIYENKSAQSTEGLIDKIRVEKNEIKEIKRYENYKMRSF